MAIPPMRMIPAYRYGRETPWGGNALGVLFGRRLPDARTGESMEVSVLQGLNSTDSNGCPLSELLREHGICLTGTKVNPVFPLLLKLIDAREQLSVQVHPDDGLAQLLEGKSGKSEAWVVLKADEGATIRYGVRENTTQAMLREASAHGHAIEEYLQSVPVNTGDVIDIPAGTIHAIGAGITLYEIQQSSDVTYRLYDWQRVDERGMPRNLHTEKALAAADTSIRYSQLLPTVIRQSPTGTRTLLLKNRHFSIERWANCRGEPLMPDPERFGIATTLSQAVFSAKDDRMAPLEANPGDSYLLPADGITMTVACDDMLVVYPALPT
jgi:mannose-6-phosphate isomerase